MQPQMIRVVYTGGSREEGESIRRILATRPGGVNWVFASDPCILNEALDLQKPDLILFRIRDVMEYPFLAVLHDLISGGTNRLLVLGEPENLDAMAHLLLPGMQAYLPIGDMADLLLQTVDSLLEKKPELDVQRLPEAQPSNLSKYAELMLHTHFVGMAIIDQVTNRFLDVNTAMLQMFDRTRDEVLGKTIRDLDLVSEDMTGEVEALFSALSEKRKIDRVETPYLRNGEKRVALVSMEWMEMDQRPCIFTVMVDITTEKTLQEELKRANAQLERRVEEGTRDLQSIQEKLVRESQYRTQAEEHRDQLVKILWEMPLMVATGAPGKPIRYMNRAGRAFLGLDEREEIRSVDFLSLYSPRMRELMEHGILPQARQNGFWRGEVELLNRSGRIVPMAQSILANREDGDSAWVYTSISRDISETKQYEEDLKKSREQYRILAESAKDLIFLTDAQGTLIYINDYACQVFQIAVHEVVGRNLSSVLNELGITLSQPGVENFLGMRMAMYVEQKVNLRGVPIWFGTRLVPVEDSQGRLQNVLGIARDITPQKRLEEELRGTQEQLERLLAVSPMVLYKIGVHDPHPMTFISSNIETIFGYPVEQFMTDLETWNQITLPEDLPVMLGMRAVLTAGSWQGDYRIRDARGNIRWIRDASMLKQDPAGNPQEIYGFVQDITRQREEQEALQKSEERYRLLAEAAQDLIFVASADMRLEYINRFGAQAVDQPLESMLGKSIFDALSAFPRTEFSKRLEQTFREGQPLSYESPVNLARGTVWLGTVLVPIPDGEGRVASVMGIARDITTTKTFEFELKKALDQEQELNALKSRFLATTSHEFRTPLSTILSSAELLEHYGEKWTTDRRMLHVKRIQGASQRMDELLSQIISLERFEAHKYRYESRTMNLTGLCREILDEIRLHDRNAHIFYLDVLEDPLSIVSDVRLVRTIVENTLSNAVKFSPAGTTVALQLRRSENSVDMVVDDQGIGISEKDQTHLFETFFRGSNAEGVTGAGWGWPIVREALDVIGGKIEIHSVEHRGTTVKIVLPTEMPHA